MGGRRVTRKGAPGSVYVGRPTFLGNPYPITRSRTRETAISMYRNWFYGHIEYTPGFAEQVRSYCADYDLACWCAPEPCHADVIREWLDGR